MARKPIEIPIGGRYGMLTVVEFIGSVGNPKSRDWKCLCDCGKITTASSIKLKFGVKKSCGCNQRGIGGLKHGLHKHKLYRTWHQMKMRCVNKRHTAFSYYGGRGISVCNEWLYGFEGFYNWAIKNNWQEDLEIDRIDNNGNYEPGNCRWATRRQQMLNTRKNRRFEIDGKTLTVTEFSRIYNISNSTIYGRLKHGWNYREAITTPVNLKMSRKKLRY